MANSQFDRFNARLQGVDNKPVSRCDMREDSDLDAIMLRLDAVQSLGGLYAQVGLSEYTRARMGIASVSEFTGDVYEHELEAVSV